MEFSYNVMVNITCFLRMNTSFRVGNVILASSIGVFYRIKDCACAAAILDDVIYYFYKRHHGLFLVQTLLLLFVTNDYVNE